MTVLRGDHQESNTLFSALEQDSPHLSPTPSTSLPHQALKLSHRPLTKRWLYQNLVQIMIIHHHYDQEINPITTMLFQLPS